MMIVLRKICLALAGASFLLALGGLWNSSTPLVQWAALVGVLATAFGIGALPRLAGYQFTAWIIASVCAAMLRPQLFLTLGPLQVAGITIPEIDFQDGTIVLAIVQLVMFGMGTKIGLSDFVNVAKMPYPVFIGILLQFTVMPLCGYGLAVLFDLPPEIAAGVVLIGSCSSGLASNVMCYLAGADLPLSITLTSIATLLAPIATPFWMNQLAGEFIEVDAWKMMMQILQIVIVPIGAALLHDALMRANGTKKYLGTVAIVAVAAAILMLSQSGTEMSATARSFYQIIARAMFFAVAYHYFVQWVPAIDRKMEYISMAGIIYFTVVTTAAGRDNLLACGLTLILVALIHNLTGYSLGFLLSRLAGLDNQKALTVGFEVGMQNGGMASSLALLMQKAATLGLAAAVFSPLMNVTGSVLANQISHYKQKHRDE